LACWICSLPSVPEKLTSRQEATLRLILSGAYDSAALAMIWAPVAWSTPSRRTATARSTVWPESVTPAIPIESGVGWRHAVNPLPSVAASRLLRAIPS